MDVKFSNDVKEAISFSREEAIRLKNAYIGPEHFVLGILRHGSNSGIELISRLGIDANSLKSELESLILSDGDNISEVSITGSIPLTKKAEKILKITYLEAKIYKSIVVSSAHVLSSILRDDENIVFKIFEKYGISYKMVADVMPVFSFVDNVSGFEQTSEGSTDLENSRNEALLKYILDRALITIRDTVEPVIGVKYIAAEISELLCNLQSSEKGKMIGVFGNWGRGKTFLMNLVWDNIKIINSSYKRVDFHAWKYQDTPAIWAYLYESLASAYYASDNKWRLIKFANRIKKSIKLNIVRNGYYNIIMFILILLGSLVLLYGIIILKPFTFDSKGKQFQGLTILGFVIPLSIALVNFVKTLIRSTYSTAGQLFKRYYDEKSFGSLLGTQAEVQKEIRALLKAWLPEHGRVLLLVDDIDRCNEEKIIQIIDSLRIMLEDSEISAKLVVLAAIDERILKMAVKRKYFDFIDKDFSMKNKLPESENVSNKMVKEYLDKLFISGIKLVKLSSSDKRQLFEVISGRSTIDVGNKSLENVDDEIPNKINDEYVRSERMESVESEVNDEFNKSQHYLLNQREFDQISSVLENLNAEMTPRQIKILYYRYLLARNILFRKYNYFTSQNEIDQVKSFLAGVLVVKCFEYDSAEFDRDVAIVDQRDIAIGDIVILGEHYKLRKELILEVSSIVNMVVGY